MDELKNYGKYQKKEYYQERKDAINFLRPRWRRCFWTWPWGHKYDLTLEHVRCCLFCNKPQFVDKTSTSKIIDLGM